MTNTLMVILIENEKTTIKYIIYENFMKIFEYNSEFIIIDMKV